MGTILKSEASAEFVAAVQKIEDTADSCCDVLAVFDYSSDIAGWAVLSRIILKIEEVAERFGYRSQTQSNVTYNLGRGGAQALRWIEKRGAAPSPGSRSGFQINSGLLQSSSTALWTAVTYEAFGSTFPLWHKNVLGAEVLPNGVVRFASENDTSRRVRAYMQGLKPEGDRDKPLDMGGDLEPLVKQKIQNIIENAQGGQFAFRYTAPMKLYREMSERFYELSESLFRRDDSLMVGTYDLGTFRKFYSALLAICGAHEHACFLRAQLMKAFPINSAVIVRRRDDWIKLISRISELTKISVSEILSDLVLGRTKMLDLYVHPFVELGNKSQLLGLVPHFPLKARADENILRVCSYLRPDLYDVITNAKEGEMRRELKKSARSGLKIRGPRRLPGSLPDIDLIIEDAPSSTVVITELKWLRKTIRAVEHIQQRDQFLYGIEQMKQIKDFLKQNSTFLFERGDTTKDLKEIENVYYVIVPRDYFVWADPAETGVSIVDYDPLARMLGKNGSLDEQMDELLGLDWLPAEGRDFEIKYEPATVNGATIETEVIYAKY